MMIKVDGKQRPLTALFAGVVVAALAGNANAEQSGKNTLVDGERMIARCLEYAASRKFPALSVGVVDQSGALVAFKRQDGASSATAEASLLKARTAMRLNAPTEALGPVAAGDASTRDALVIMQMTTLPGGVPFSDKDGRLAGAVGVSGGASDQDAQCALQAIETGHAKNN